MLSNRRGSWGALRIGALWAARVVAALLLAVLVAGVWQFRQLQGSLDRQAVLVSLVSAQRDRLLQMVNEETGVRGYIATGDARFLQIYYQSRPQAFPDAATQERADAVQRYFAQEITLARAGHLERARARLENGRAQFDALRLAEARAEGAAQATLGAQRRHTRFLAQAGFFASIVLCVALIFTAFGFTVLLRRARAYRLTALRDPLTGATNRRGALAAIEALIAQSHNEPFGLIFIDLDGFKKINDTYGHAVGDAILKLVASRLFTELRETDTVCRLGGDEFVSVIAPPTSAEHMRGIADRLQRAVERPYPHEKESYLVGCSAGMSLYPRDARSAEGLLERADRAMYRAKTAAGSELSLQSS